MIALSSGEEPRYPFDWGWVCPRRDGEGRRHALTVNGTPVFQLRAQSLYLHETNIAATPDGRNVNVLIIKN
jgi:hypothetical protein